jgi:putative thioredoxin
MIEARHEITATDANFMAEVVEASASKPVLVDFWAPWCGPCRTLTPLLDRIADDYAGRVTLAKVNTDEEPRLATRFGIRSIPTVMLFHQGKVVEQFVGVQPESTIRAMIDRYLGPDVAGNDVGNETSDLAKLAAAQLERRDAPGAAGTIEQLAAAEPEHALLAALRARLAFVEAAVARPDVLALRAALERDPGDAAARHALAAHYALAGDYATATSEWLELLRRDRRFGDDLARRSLLMAFDVLGDGHELALAARRRMASLLH